MSIENPEIQGGHEPIKLPPEVTSFLGAMRSEALSPHGDDDILGALCHETQRQFTLDDALGHTVTTFILERPDLDTQHAVFLWTKTWNKLAHITVPDFPYIFERFSREQYGSVWSAIMSTVLADPDAYAELMKDLLTQTVSKTIGGRGMLLSLFIGAGQHVGRFPESPEIVEAGAGRNHILPMIQSIGRLGLKYRPVKVFNPGGDFPEDPYDVQYDDELSIATNRLLELPRHLGDCLAIDLKSLADPEQAVFSRYNFRPREEIDEPWKLEQYDMLEELRQAPDQKNIVYTRSDITDPGILQQVLRSRAGLGADVVYFPTSMYQNSPSKRQDMMRFGLAATHEEGFVIIQDAAHAHPGSHWVPRFYKSWGQKWRYRFIVFDKANPKSLQEFIICDSESINEIVYGKTKLWTSHGEYSLSEIILDIAA